MDRIKAIQSVNEIKELMERSSKFVSLSGLTGILVGVYSLIGAWLVSVMAGIPLVNQLGNGRLIVLSQTQIITLISLIAGGVMLASIISTLLIAYYKSSKSN